ncbi:ATP-binding protein [Streptomyces sp. NPDC127097]|uniref:ATP-binding protein n=1 Tax=Streptomyces sp. NPDC127097 TaxID=3347136 RepID=UPI00366A43FB
MSERARRSMENDHRATGHHPAERTDHSSPGAGPGPAGGEVQAELTSFVGRRREVDGARQLLTRTRLLTLTGAGGIGKTRLALRVASEVRRSYPGGVWVVDLAPLEDGALLAQTVLAALGLDHDSARPPMRTLADHLQDRRLLLVLDNCEHLLDACAELIRVLLAAAPGMQVLATSRQALRVEGEHLMVVPPLSTPELGHPVPPGELARYEAVRLFADRALAVYGDFILSPDTLVTVARICHRLEGIPLAIELAAARLRVLSPRQILDRLDNRFALLTRGSRAALPRWRTLRAAIDWSYELCTPPEQRLWASLSVFCGGFDLEAVEEVCAGEGLPRETVLDVVTELVDKSILSREDHQGQVRYRMLETIRQYGRALLEDGGTGPRRETVRRRHRDHYQQLATRAEAEWFGPRQMAWFARLRLENANLRAALEFCLGTPGEHRAGLQLVTSLWSHRLGVSGVEEQRSWLGRALALDTGPSPARARALWVDGWLAFLRGDVATGHARLAACQELADTLGEAGPLADAVQFAGLAALFQDEFRRAIPLLEDALGRHRANGDLGAQWTTLFLLALSYCLADDPRATPLGEECLALCDTHDARWSRSYALWALGLQRWLAGSTGEAIALLQDALRGELPHYNLLATAQCLEVLAWATARDGKPLQAARLLGAAQTLWVSLGAALPGLGRLLQHHTECELRLRSALGDAPFAAAVRDGAGLPLDEAIACALGRPDPVEERPARPGAPGPLTRREHQVVSLLVAGLTDKEIAARLVISARTAEGHVQRILAKLGFHSRTQVAVWAVAQGVTAP